MDNSQNEFYTIDKAQYLRKDRICYEYSGLNSRHSSFGCKGLAGNNSTIGRVEAFPIHSMGEVPISFRNSVMEFYSNNGLEANKPLGSDVASPDALVENNSTWDCSSLENWTSTVPKDNERLLVDLKTTLLDKQSDPLIINLVTLCLSPLVASTSNELGSEILNGELKRLSDFAIKRKMRRRTMASFNLIDHVKAFLELEHDGSIAQYIPLIEDGGFAHCKEYRLQAIRRYINKKPKRLTKPKTRYLLKQSLANTRKRRNGRFQSLTYCYKIN